MSFYVAKCFSKFSRCIPYTRNLLSGRSVSRLYFKIGEDAQNIRTITRSHSFLCRGRDSSSDASGLLSVNPVITNKCGCGYCLHTKGDKELVAFLEEEITKETKAQVTTLPKLNDFECHLDGSLLMLTRTFNEEKITIKSNVNHSVDSEAASEEIENSKDQGITEVLAHAVWNLHELDEWLYILQMPASKAKMESRPDFTVEIEKDGKIFSLDCSLTDPYEGTPDTTEDSFQINSISVYKGEYQDSTYSASADLMDGYLYDLLMNYLEERGITNDFAEKMISHFTSYEHQLYISLLRGLKKFVEG